MERRRFIQYLGRAGALVLAGRFAPAYAFPDPRSAAVPASDRARAPGGEDRIDLVIDRLPFAVGGRSGTAIAANGSVPGPLLRLHEGRLAVIRVENRLDEVTSIHWHGFIIPPEMDGVPGVSFTGIAARSTFTYRFPVRQSGTYWAHSHSGGQEQLGLYFPVVIDPVEPEPFRYDRDYVVVLSDWSFASPDWLVSRLKKQSGYYNYGKQTTPELARQMRRRGAGGAIADRWGWAKMRMDPTDLSDVSGESYTYLMNGLAPGANWTGLFRPGEAVRLRFIGAAAMTLFDVRIPELKMRVVQVDGQNVRPVEVDEFRIAPGETYDVIVSPGDGAHTVFAESLDRSGYARGTLATRIGAEAPIPPRRARPIRGMSDMGMSMSGEGHGAETMPGMGEMSGMAGMEEAEPHGAHGTDHTRAPAGHGLKGPALPGSPPVVHGPDTHGVGNSMTPMSLRSRLDDPGSGLDPSVRRVLVYADLESLEPGSDRREPTREIELHLTGNMDRYMWSFDGKKYSEAKTPIHFEYGERLRLFLVNDTMMEHPIHLHGMFMDLENGRARLPRKHTITVKPAERLSLAITADARGRWAMHCHLLLHMEMGMFRVVEVSDAATGRRS